MAARQKQDRGVARIPLENIKPRIEDTRPATAEGVLTKAESIAAVGGLLSSITVDRAHRLMAGLPRLLACRLLLAPPAERARLLAELPGKVKDAEKRLSELPPPSRAPKQIRDGRAPCIVKTEIDAEKNPGAALAIEAAENTARANYKRGEVERVVQRLKAAGYQEMKGRPKPGQKPLKPMLQSTLGISERQAWNILNPDAARKRRQTATFTGALRKLSKPLAQVEGQKLSADTKAPTLKRALGLAEELAALLPDAIKEADTLTKAKN
jgi:ParB family chromosome partitioning protein